MLRSTWFFQPSSKAFATSTNAAYPTALFQLSTIISLLKSNTTYTNVGSIYTVATSENLEIFITALDTTSDLQTDGTVNVTGIASLKDMGRNITIGVKGGDSAIIIFRLVQYENQTKFAGYNGGTVGYVVVENKAAVAGSGLQALAYRS